MTEHRNHALKPQASGTSDHLHHRGTIEHDGIRVAYWRCAVSTSPDPQTPYCPNEPDPWVLLTKKHAEAIIERASRQKPARDRCRYGHGAEHQTRNSQGSAVCLECRRLASIRARMKRAATRIVAAALAA